MVVGDIAIEVIHGMMFRRSRPIKRRRGQGVSWNVSLFAIDQYADFLAPILREVVVLEEPSRFLVADTAVAAHFIQRDRRP